MTFKHYILNVAQVNDTPVGDFISDARDDKKLPDTASEILSKVSFTGFYGASAAAKSAYKNYVGYCKRHSIGYEIVDLRQ